VVWLIRRVATAVVLAFIVATIVFLTLHIVPGDPAEILLSTGGSAPDPALVEDLRRQLGLDQPLWQQYIAFLDRLVRLDLGRSLVDDYPVAAEVGLRLPRTLQLIAAGVVLSILVGIPCGVLAALNPGGAFDRIASTTAAVLLAVPVFVLGTLLILVLAQQLRLMPAGGYVDPLKDFPGFLVLVSMPAVAIAKGLAAVLFRMTRTSVLDVLSRDFVRTAKAKGLSPLRIAVRHVLRNALVPILTVLSLHMGTLLGGTVLIELVFNWPGLSTPLLRAVEGRDYPMVVGIVITISGLFLAINLVTDLIYGWLDPRVRTS
jgi:peptide/nickel transport system permease protein